MEEKIEVYRYSYSLPGRPNLEILRADLSTRAWGATAPAPHDSDRRRGLRHPGRRVMESAAKDPWLSITVEREPGQQPFVLVVPLGLNREQRAAVMRILEDVHESMRRAYDPRPCPCCSGSGDARDVVGGLDGDEAQSREA